MESSNPVFSRQKEFQRGGYATFGSQPQQPMRPETMSPEAMQDLYNAPSATSIDTGRMTLDDVVLRTALLFAVLLATAAPTYFLLQPGFGIVIVAALVGLGLSLWATMSKTVRPGVMLAYAAVEGVFVGGVSYWYGSIYDGIVAQAVLGTLAAFGAMLALYKTGVVKNSPKFQKTLMIAGVGYLAFALINILGTATGAWDSVYAGGGLLAIGLSAFGVVLASFFLVLDFDFVEQGIRNGLPEKYAWTAAFGLVVTLVWLYLEILRLIAILRGDN